MLTAITKNNFNLKIYSLISLVSTCAILMFAQNMLEIFAILFCLFSTVLNHYLLYYSVKEFLNPHYIEHPESKPSKRIIAAVIVKFAVLVLAFILAARIMDKRVLLPILNYIVMIFALVFVAMYKVKK